MKRIGFILCTLVFSSLSWGGEYYRLYWGGDNSACLYGTATDSNTDWTITGAATVHEAIDDKTTTPCYGYYYSDLTTTMISCLAASITCTATLTLSDSPASGLVDIVTVSPWAMVNRGAGSGKTGSTLSVYFVIGGSDYLACTLTASDTAWSGSRARCGATPINPATLVGWTKADLDGLKLKLAKTSSANFDLQVTAAGVGIGYTGGE